MVTTAKAGSQHDRAVALLMDAFAAEVVEEVGEQNSPSPHPAGVSHDEKREHDKIGAALGYVERGWAVFPLYWIRDGACACGKGDCDSPGKHPRVPNGFKHATKDEDQVRRWWERWPDANIGIRTGAVSGIFVLDIDGDTGDRSVAELQERFALLPDTKIVLTARGCHLYFVHPGRPIKNRTGVVPHVDVRGDGGYVVAPPSDHHSGAIYRWA